MDVVISENLRPQSPEVETASPFRFYQVALEKGKVDPNNVFSPYKIDNDDLAAIAGDFIDSSPIFQLPWIDPIQTYLTDEELSKLASRATRDSIDAIYKLGIVNRDLIVNASKYLGPGNTVVKSGTDTHFNKADWLTYDRETRNGSYPSIPYEHPTRSERNQHLALEVDRDQILEYAGAMSQFGKEIKGESDDRGALNLAMRLATAHEYGHAIDLALRKSGKETTDVALKLGIDKYRIAHQERFARAFEMAVLPVFLQELGYSAEGVESFSKKWVQYRSPFMESAESYIKEMESRGYTLGMILAAEENLNRAVLNEKDKREGRNVRLVRLDLILRDGLSAYTPEEIKLILRKPTV